MKNAVALVLVGFAAVFAGVRMDMGIYVIISGIVTLVAGINYGFLLLKKREAEKFYAEQDNLPPDFSARKSAA
ncbi:MAG: hypothetical protein ACLFQW_07710 [Spirochaetaceae bacterium]